MPSPVEKAKLGAGAAGSQGQIPVNVSAFTFRVERVMAETAKAIRVLRKSFEGPERYPSLFPEGYEASVDPEHF